MVDPTRRSGLLRLLAWQAAGAGVALGTSLIALKFLPAPFIWIPAIWSACGIAVVTLAQPMAVRLTALLATVSLLTLGAAEAFLWWWPPPPQPERFVTPSYNEPDSILGWRLKPNVVSRVVERLGDSILYAVSYTIDAIGRRIEPPYRGTPDRGCALFFVCSYTFGEGLADDQTLPFRVGLRAGGRVRAIDFATPAYGVEHLVAGLEHGLIAAPSSCRTTHIILQTIPHHVLRAAGLVEFAQAGPRYTVTGDGQLVGGSLRRPEYGAVVKRAHQQLAKSRLWKVFASRDPRPSATDFRLYLALLRRSRDLLAQLYPDAQLDILLWSRRDQHAGRLPLRDSVTAITPRVHLVDDILPDYRTHPERYEIHPRDAHPNALAADLLARFVVDSILRLP